MADPTTLSKMTEEVVRHRFNEAAMLVRAAERVLREVRSVAGAVNGMATMADARAQDCMTLVTTLEEHLKEAFPRPHIEGLVEHTSPELAKAVAKAKEKAS